MILYVAVALALNALPQDTGLLHRVLEWKVEDRWIMARQHADFVPLQQNSLVLPFDSVQSTDSLRKFVMGGKPGLNITVDGRGAPVKAVLTARAAVPGQVDPMRQTRWRVQFGTQSHTPSVIAAELWRRMPAQLRRGLRWRDSLRVRDDVGGITQEVVLHTSFVAETDSLVDGRRLWLIRDSSAFQFRDSFPDPYHAGVYSVRRAVGFLRGRGLYDPALGIYVMHDDTTRAAGTYTRIEEKVVAAAPARYERTRTLRLYTAPEWVRLQAQRRAQQPDDFRIVDTPRPGLEQRLARGDTAVVDSVFKAWRAARDPQERRSILGLLGRVRSPEMLERIRSAALADGDTAKALEFSLGPRALNEDQVMLIARFVRDPRMAMEHGVDRMNLIDRIYQKLTWGAPAIVTDSARLGCSPATCELLARELADSRAEDARDLALVAQFVINPRAVYPRIVQKYNASVTRTSVLQRIYLLAQGVGEESRPNDFPPIPKADSDWRAWWSWLIKRLPAGANYPRALLFYTNTHDRDLTSELKREFAKAESDSAKLVFGSVLAMLEPRTFSVAEIEQKFATDNEAMRSLGRQMLRASARFERGADARSLELWRIGLRYLGGDSLAWTTGKQSSARPRPKPSDRTYVLVDSLPPELRSTLPASIQGVTATEARQKSPYQALSVYTVSVVRWGNFYRLELRMTGQLAKPEGARPYVYMGGETFLLFWHDGRWDLVAHDSFMT